MNSRDLLSVHWIVVFLLANLAVAAPSHDDPPVITDWRRSFVNPIYEGADPWVIQHEGYYYTCQSEGNRGVAVYRSRRLTDLGEKHVVWQAPREGRNSRQIWAPELHRLGERWYIYTAASDGENRNHRMWALESAGGDPLGPYHVKGELYTGDDVARGTASRWAIDGTPLEHDGTIYHLWSGWDAEEDEQFLYIAEMSNPWTISSNRVKLCDNDDYLWERVDEQPSGRGLHEAPQVLERDGRVFVIYSASGSWQPSYKMGMLELKVGGDPMKSADWVKHPEPVFSPTDATLGTAHCTFVRSPDGTENWLLYHAKVDREPGWRRAVYAQRFAWKSNGLPDFGTPVAPGAALALPSGEPPLAIGEAAVVSDSFSKPFRERWQYFGHQQYVRQRDGRLHLGRAPLEPVNTYRRGEKALWREDAFGDGSVAVTLRIDGGVSDAGILFRVQHPAVGYDAHKGYFVGVVPGSNRVIAGKSDGRRWTELARADASIETGREYRLEVIAKGSNVQVRLDGKQVLGFKDAEWSEGQVGLRVVDTHASFDDFQVKRPPPGASK